MEYKHPTGAYPLCNFHKICKFCTPFQAALAVKISLDLLVGLRSYGGFKLTGSGYPQIFRAPYGETMRQPPPQVMEVQVRARGPPGVKLLLKGCGSPTESMVEIQIPVSRRVAIAYGKLFWCSNFGRPFAKRFALCYQTVVRLSCPVCDVGVLC